MIFFTLLRAEKFNYPIFLELTSLAKSVQTLILQPRHWALRQIFINSIPRIPFPLPYEALHFLHHLEEDVVDRNNRGLLEADFLRTLPACHIFHVYIDTSSTAPCSYSSNWRIRNVRRESPLGSAVFIGWRMTIGNLGIWSTFSPAKLIYN